MLARANISWLTHPPAGSGRARVESHAFTELPMSLAVERDPLEGEATPGEMLASAYGSAYIAALAEQLDSENEPVDELVVDVECDVSGEGLRHRLAAVGFRVHGRGAKLEAGGFDSSARRALTEWRRCLRLGDDLPVTLDAHLAHQPRSVP